MHYIHRVAVAWKQLFASWLCCLEQYAVIAAILRSRSKCTPCSCCAQYLYSQVQLIAHRLVSLQARSGRLYLVRPFLHCELGEQLDAVMIWCDIAKPHLPRVQIGVAGRRDGSYRLWLPVNVRADVADC